MKKRNPGSKRASQVRTAEAKAARNKRRKTRLLELVKKRLKRVSVVVGSLKQQIKTLEVQLAEAKGTAPKTEVTNDAG